MTSIERPTLAVVQQPHTHPGHLDLATRERISGWAMGADASEPVALQVLDNGRPIARVLSNMYRPDLEEAGHGNGRYGFDVAIPGGLSPLTRHLIQVRREADGAELVGSPRMIDASDAFDAGLEQAVAQAIAAIGEPAERERVLAFLATQSDVLLQQRADAESGRRERDQHQRHVRRMGPLAAVLTEPPRRALVIDARVPVEGRDAGSQAMLSHVRALQGLGYAVSLVATDELAGDAAEAMRAQQVTLCGQPFYASVEEVLRRQGNSFDLVYLHRARVASAYLNLVRQHQPRARLLYSVADLHHLRLERQAAVEERPELLAEARVLRLLECTAAWQADAVLTHSEVEATLLRRMVPEAAVHCVPWAVPARPSPRIVGHPRFATRRGIAFIGHYAHEPNGDAARWLLEAVMPAVWAADPAIECMLVGSAMPEALRRLAQRDKRVQALGHVADLRAGVLDRVRLTVAPLRFGAGVKGKVLESLAAGVPCAMTPVAAEGLALPEALQAFVAHDAEGLAEAILRLHGDAKAHAVAAKASLAFMRTEGDEASVQAALLAAIEGRRPSA